MRLSRAGTKPTWCVFGAVIGLMLLAGNALGAKPARDKLDPKLLRAFDTGILGLSQPHVPGPVSRVRALVELTQHADPAALARLTKSGAQVVEARGRPLVWKNWAVVSVNRSAAMRIAALDVVERVAFLPRNARRPMDVSAGLIGLDAARGSRPVLDRLTGSGILIGDNDSNIDVFHPVFFHGDAGYYDWIDVDGSLQFKGGVDAIDLDRDGIADPNEVAQLLLAQTSRSNGDSIPARTESFDAGVDWLYLDDNGNQERDFGAASGFDDSVPAFGEPLFVPDDVNRNGQLDRGERVVRLGTSKIRKVYVSKDWVSPTIDHVFERGVDLATIEPDYTNEAAGYPDSLHATMVNSVAIGDVPLVGRRWVGIAPDAEVVVSDSSAESGVIWLLGEKPDVMLHEMATWTGYPLDGGDVLSELVDQSVVEDNVTHTCPTGNMAPSGKHARAQLTTGTSQTLKFDVPPSTSWLYYVELSLNVQQASTFQATLVDPSGTSHVLQAGTTYPSPNILYVTTLEASSKGNQFVDLILYSIASTHSVPPGSYSVELAATSSSTATVDAYLADSLSVWGEWVAWEPAIAIQEGTIGVPATADHCIAVGAFPAHLNTPDEPWFTGDEVAGEVRDYSGRGPRIDGMQKPDVVAPDNPWTALAHYPSGGIGHGLMFVGGGTSAATPHVTGVAALMAQAGVRGDAVRDALRESALSDTVTGQTPNADYGFGRLSAAGAFGVAANGSRPSISVVASPEVAAVGSSVELVPNVNDTDGGGLEVKWDDGYDGTWDIPYAPPASRTISQSALGRYPYKARVRDATGRIAEAVVWVTFADALPDGGPPSAKPDPPDGGAAEGGGCGCKIRDAEDGGNPVPLVVSLALIWWVRRRLTDTGTSP